MVTYCVRESGSSVIYVPWIENELVECRTSQSLPHVTSRTWDYFSKKKKTRKAGEAGGGGGGGGDGGDGGEMDLLPRGWKRKRGKEEGRPARAQKLVECSWSTATLGIRLHSEWESKAFSFGFIFFLGKGPRGWVEVAKAKDSMRGKSFSTEEPGRSRVGQAHHRHLIVVASGGWLWTEYLLRLLLIH